MTEYGWLFKFLIIDDTKCQHRKSWPRLPILFHYCRAFLVLKTVLLYKLLVQLVTNTKDDLYIRNWARYTVQYLSEEWKWVLTCSFVSALYNILFLLNGKQFLFVIFSSMSVVYMVVPTMNLPICDPFGENLLKHGEKDSEICCKFFPQNFTHEIFPWFSESITIYLR